MSLHQISLSSSASSPAMLQPRPCSATPVRGASTPGVTIRGGGELCLLSMTSKEQRRRRSCRVRCSLETAEAVVGQVTEVDKDTFWPIVSASGDKVVVLDMYTQWHETAQCHSICDVKKEERKRERRPRKMDMFLATPLQIDPS